MRYIVNTDAPTWCRADAVVLDDEGTVLISDVRAALKALDIAADVVAVAQAINRARAAK